MKKSIKLYIFVVVLIGTILGFQNVKAAEYSDLEKNNELGLSFENNIKDNSSNHIIANLVGNEKYVDGIKGRAIQFDGATYIDLGESRELQPKDITISFWIKIMEPLSNEHMIMWCKPDGNYMGDGWYLTSLNDEIPLKLSVGSVSEGLPLEAYTQNDRNGFFGLKTWTYIAVTFEDKTKTAKIYRNGELQNTNYINDCKIAITSTRDHKYIGFNSPKYKGGYAKVIMDELEIYSKSASSSEVLKVYQEGRDSYIRGLQFQENIKWIKWIAVCIGAFLFVFLTVKKIYHRLLMHLTKDIYNKSKEIKTENVESTLKYDYPYTTVAIIQMKNREILEETLGFDEDKKENVRGYIEKLIQDTLGIETECMIIPDKNRAFIIVIHSGERMDNLSRENMKLSLVYENMKNLIGKEFTLGLSECTNEKGKFYEVYLQAALAVEYSFVFGNNNLIGYQDLSHRKMGYNDNKAYMYSQMVQYITKKEADPINTEAYELINNIITQSINEDDTLEGYRKLRLDLITEFERVTMKYGVEKQNSETRFKELITCDTFPEFREQLIQDLEEFKVMMYKKSESQLIDQVKEYIHENYWNTELNINLLGEIFDITPSYLSKQFKDKLEISLLDYLNCYRMEKAKELLTDKKLTIEQIAAQIGFLSSSVFIRTFKKIENITPGAYRKSNEI